MLQPILGFAAFQAGDQVLRVEVDADGVLGEEGAGHVGVGVVGVGEVVHLGLQHVAVGVLVVDAGGDAVVDAPDRVDVAGAALAVGQEQVRQGGEGEGDVFQTARPRVLGRDARFRRPHRPDQGDPVVFLVVADERQPVPGSVRHLSAQERGVEVQHRLEIVRPQHHVCQPCRRLYFAPRCVEVGQCRPH